MSDWSKLKFDHIRREYDRDQLDESTLPDDPLLLFVSWMEAATNSNSPDPTAMTLSTVDAQGIPSSRIVLLKKIHRKRLIFFTNYQSRKAREIHDRASVAAHLFWPGLERQVRIAGVAGMLEDEDSDLYFSSRPFESQVAAWASPQSKEVPGRKYLEDEYMKYLTKFEGLAHVPRPGHWGGYYITPQRMEFWQGGRHRLHDRIEYRLEDKLWSRVRLAP